MPGEEAGEQSLGLKMSDLLALPEPLSGLLNWMIRQGPVTLADVTAFLAQSEDLDPSEDLDQGEERARALLANLRDKGYVSEVEIHGATQYRVRLAPRRGYALPSSLWDALDDKTEHGGEEPR